MDSWEQVRRQISCCHVMLRHEHIPYARDGTRQAKVNFHIDRNGGMCRLGPCRTMFINQGVNDVNVEKRIANVGRFVEQIAMLKRRDERIK